MPRLLSDVLVVLAVGAAIGLVPLAIGFFPRMVFDKRGKSWIRFSAGAALGFMVVFLNDLIDDSGGLGESLGLSFSPIQVALPALFVLGFGLLMMLSITARDSSPSSIVYLIAGAIGLHALAEGIVIGSNFVGQLEIEELSTIYQGLSFALHKFLEGFTMSIFLIPKAKPKMLLASVLLAGIPLLVGIPLGMFAYPAIIANLLFAAGAGAAVFIILKIAEEITKSKPSTITLIGFFVGFVVVYFATLIHFTVLQ